MQRRPFLRLHLLSSLGFPRRQGGPSEQVDEDCLCQ